MAKRELRSDDDATTPDATPAKAEKVAKEPRGPLFVGLRSVLLPVVALTLLTVLSAAVLLSGFQSQRPHELPIGVTGGQASVDTVARQIASGSDPAFQVVPVPEGTKPGDMVKSREVYGALSIADNGWQLSYAGANGATVNNFISNALRPSPTSKIAYTFVDVMPSAKGDPYSWAVFFLVLAGAISAFVFGLVLAYRAAPLSTSATFAALALFSVVAGVATTLVVRYYFEALQSSPVVPAVLQVLLLFVVSALTLAFTRLGRAYGAALAALLFVAIGTAYSGSLLPPQFLPKNASFLVDLLPNGLFAQATTGASYFDGDSVTTGVGGLIVWAVIAGVVLVALDRRASRSAVVGN